MKHILSRPILALYVLSLLALIGGGVLAEDGKPQDPADPMDAAAMEAFMKAATPGEHHAHLTAGVGTWRAETTMWMYPGAEPTRSTGTMTVESILGGRFTRSRFVGTMMGQPFEGIAIDGYDNVLDKHTGTWMDSMGTMTMAFEGDCTEGGTILKMAAEFLDPITGQPSAMKTKTTQVDENTIKWEGWSRMPDGSFYRSMENVYRRQ